MPKAHYESTGDLGEIVLSNPPLNVFDQELMDDLHATVTAAGEASPRALILRAEGKVFTAGVEVHVRDEQSVVDFIRSSLSTYAPRQWPLLLRGAAAPRLPRHPRQATPAQP